MLSAKIIADSISPSGIRLTTLELKFHRFILPEFMTHRMFSRNASSSRAIPVEKMIHQVKNNAAFPEYWGKNQPGMQAREEVEDTEACIELWWEAAFDTADTAEAFKDLGVHKQITNRLLEPFQWISVVVTSTEWNNFFKLRLHKDAQPEMRVLAEHMKKAMDESTPVELQPGEWHLPYVDCNEFDIKEEALKCSVARCARVSYLNHDNSTPDVDKDIALADMLLEAGHMSPLEHQLTPMESPKDNYNFEKGVTHIDRDGWKWSGNFRSWVMYRKLLDA